MPKKIYIIGGGHAGSSAALAAMRAKQDLTHTDDLEIHLIDKNPYMTIKPRLYEYELEETIIPFSKFLSPAGVSFHKDEMLEIDVNKKQLQGKEALYNYDVLIIAPGSQLHQNSTAYNVNSYEASMRLKEELKVRLSRNLKEPLQIAILGAGFTGIELATEFPANIRKHCKALGKETPGFQISLFDHGEVGASLGEEPKSVIVEALDQEDIQKVSFVHILEATKNMVEFEDDTKRIQRRHFDFVINTMGQRPNGITRSVNAKRDASQRIIVDTHLRVPGNTSLFAVGDVASVKTDSEHTALMTCQQGRPQGRYAGYNAVAFLSGHPLVEYRQPFYLTCLDLGDYGALYTEGWDREVRVTGNAAKRIKEHINKERIYPPVSGDKEELYRSAKLVFESPLKTIQFSKYRWRTDNAF